MYIRNIANSKSSIVLVIIILIDKCDFLKYYLKNTCLDYLN